MHQPAYAEDGSDLCYVKDCARGIALAPTCRETQPPDIQHRRRARDQQAAIAATLKTVIPTLIADLPPDRNPDGPGHDTYLDIIRIQQDTGHQPTYGLEHGIPDYIDWLRAGHEC